MTSEVFWPKSVNNSTMGIVRGTKFLQQRNRHRKFLQQRNRRKKFVQQRNRT